MHLQAAETLENQIRLPRTENIIRLLQIYICVVHMVVHIHRDQSSGARCAAKPRLDQTTHNPPTALTLKRTKYNSSSYARAWPANDEKNKFDYEYARCVPHDVSFRANFGATEGHWSGTKKTWRRSRRWNEYQRVYQRTAYTRCGGL